MIELPDGTVLLREGEVLPARCPECGQISLPLGPSEGKDWFQCPQCGEWTRWEDLGEWRFVEPAESDQ